MPFYNSPKLRNTRTDSEQCETKSSRWLQSKWTESIYDASKEALNSVPLLQSDVEGPWLDEQDNTESPTAKGHYPEPNTSSEADCITVRRSHQPRRRELVGGTKRHGTQANEDGRVKRTLAADPAAEQRREQEANALSQGVAKAERYEVGSDEADEDDLVTLDGKPADWKEGVRIKQEFHLLGETTVLYDLYWTKNPRHTESPTVQDANPGSMIFLNVNIQFKHTRTGDVMRSRTLKERQSVLLLFGKAIAGEKLSTITSFTFMSMTAHNQSA